MKKRWVMRLLAFLIVCDLAFMAYIAFFDPRVKVTGRCLVYDLYASRPPAPCEGGVVTAKRISDGAVWTTKTDKKGCFSFRLPPGDYDFSPPLARSITNQVSVTGYGVTTTVARNSDEVKLVIKIEPIEPWGGPDDGNVRGTY